MDGLNEIIDQLIAEPPLEPMEQAEINARTVTITALFAAKGLLKDNPDTKCRCRQYIDCTSEIPFGVLVLAVKALIRAHPYKDAPAPANIWAAARRVAGMHREQHCVGSGYLPPPKKWPPEGKRYGVCYGEFEDLPAISIAALNDPQRAARYLGCGK